MKTTIDLPYDLILQAKRTALDRHTTLKALIMNGLRREIESAAEEKAHGMKAIVSVGQNDWRQTDADRYVEQERAGWE